MTSFEKHKDIFGIFYRVTDDQKAPFKKDVIDYLKGMNCKLPDNVDINVNKRHEATYIFVMDRSKNRKEGLYSIDLHSSTDTVTSVNEYLPGDDLNEIEKQNELGSFPIKFDAYELSVTNDSLFLDDGKEKHKIDVKNLDTTKYENNTSAALVNERVDFRKDQIMRVEQFDKLDEYAFIVNRFEYGTNISPMILNVSNKTAYIGEVFYNDSPEALAIRKSADDSDILQIYLTKGGQRYNQIWPVFIPADPAAYDGNCYYGEWIDTNYAKRFERTRKIHAGKQVPTRFYNYFDYMNWISE